jgi:hypothetical protein
MPLLLPLLQATCNKQPLTSRNTRQKLSSFLRLGAAIPTAPSSIAGSTSQIAYSGPERRPNGGGAKAAVWAVVAIFSVVVTVLVSGVTVAGLNVQFASAGNPVQEKLIGLVNELCGVAVKVNVAGCPAVMVVLVGFEVSVKSVTWKLWLTGVAAA